MKLPLPIGWCAFVYVAITAPALQARPLPLERLVAAKLEVVSRTLSTMCADECGEVELDPPSREVANAEVHVLGASQSRLVYNSAYFDTLRARYGDSTVLAVVAHEYGHHLDKAFGTSWDHELRADAFAGCALARTGTKLGPTLRWMRREHFHQLLDRVYADPTDPTSPNGLLGLGARHPDWYYRIDALQRGAALCRRDPPTSEQFVAHLDASFADQVESDPAVRSRQVFALTEPTPSTLDPVRRWWTLDVAALGRQR